MMIADTYFVFNKGYFINTPQSFNDERFDLQKAIIKLFVEANGFETWYFIINGLFIPTYYIDNKI